MVCANLRPSEFIDTKVGFGVRPRHWASHVERLLLLPRGRKPTYRFRPEGDLRSIGPERLHRINSPSV